MNAAGDHAAERRCHPDGDGGYGVEPGGVWRRAAMDVRGALIDSGIRDRIRRLAGLQSLDGLIHELLPEREAGLGVEHEALCLGVAEFTADRPVDDIVHFTRVHAEVVSAADDHYCAAGLPGARVAFHSPAVAGVGVGDAIHWTSFGRVAAGAKRAANQLPAPRQAAATDDGVSGYRATMIGVQVEPARSGAILTIRIGDATEHLVLGNAECGHLAALLTRSERPGFFPTPDTEGGSQ